MDRKTNPNGANQYQPDPRQKLCWELYANPKSETFGNGLQSAIKAGYTEGTANQITTEDWFIERLRRMNMLSKAEKVLEYTLDMDDFEETEKGLKRNPAITKIKQDSAKFVAERVGKEHYSTRVENTGANGEPFSVTVVNFSKKEEN